MSSRKLLDRRAFVSRVGVGLVAPFFITGDALGGRGKKPASERIVLGNIGTGGRGGFHLGQDKNPRASIAAVCDVDSKRLAAAERRVGDCDAYTDFRRIIDRDDIDAVIIATPDHWHAVMTIMACRSGKDVYCEKPLSLTVVEGRKMVEAARRYERVVQMGTQHRSRGVIRKVCEWIRNGRLGDVREVRLWKRRNFTHKLIEPGSPPEQLDYDMWLGPAPMAPYYPVRCHYNFRWWLDYAGGYMTDWGAHMISVVSWAMGADETGPRTVDGHAKWYPDNLYTTPVEVSLRYEFKDPDFTMTWEQPGDGEVDGRDFGMQFIGSEATITEFFGAVKVNKGTPDLSPTRPDEIHLRRSDDHHKDWYDCIETRRRPIVDVEIGHRMTAWCHLGNIACRLGRGVRWDAENEIFIGDASADRFLMKPYRAPWRL